MAAPSDPQPVSSFKDISVAAQYVQKEEYLRLIQDRPVSTDIITQLPPYTDRRVQAIEEALEKKGMLTFEKVFNDPTGYYLFSKFLRSYPGHCPDHALFLKDDEAFQAMRFHNARFRVARLMFNRYLGPDLEAELQAELNSNQKGKPKKNKQKQPKDGKGFRIPAEARVGVFEAIRRRNEEKRKGLIPTIVRSMSGRRMSKAAHEAAAAGVQLEEKETKSPTALSDDEKGVTRTISLSSYGEFDPNEQFEVAPDQTNALQMNSEALRQVAQSLHSGKAPRNLFTHVSREIRELLGAKAFPKFLESDLYRTYIRSKVLEEQRVGVEDFIIIRVLGKGGFGTVYAVRKIDSGCIYAMKSINKRLIKHKKAVAMTMLERHSLSLIHSRFVCGLHYAFQDSTHLFLVLDLMTGGDLKFHLSKARAVSRANSRQNSRGNSPRVIQPSIKSTGTPRNMDDGAGGGRDMSQSAAASTLGAGQVTQGFSEERARFHAAEILLGLESMHSKNIIFRDLKLENVLLSNEGHARLTDLGLVALYGKKKISHYAGTPGYIAPEVALKKAYGPAVDMFSLGVTIYRMISGKKPFRGQTRQDFDRAVCQDEPVFDRNTFSEDAISLIQGLLCKVPEERLGCGKGRLGAQAIKDHPFFASIDWGLLEVGYRDPPFTPSMAAVNTNTHIHESAKEKEAAAQYNQLVLDDKFDKQIVNFDYVSKSAVRAEIVAALQKQEESERAAVTAQQEAPSECCIIL